MPDDSARGGSLALPRKEQSLFRTSGLITLVNLIGRFLGFLGDTVKSHYFGAGGSVDAFNVAAAVPTLLNDLLIQSLVNSTFVPVFSQYQQSRQELAQLFRALLTLTTLLFTVVVLVMELLAPMLAHLLNGGAPADIQNLTANLLRITVPVLLLLNLSGLLSAFLYARQRVVLPTIAAMALNGAILAAALLLQDRFGIFALAIGLVLGAILQVAALLIGLRGAVSSYRVVFWHPGLRRMIGLFSPILLGLLVEILISRPLTYALASQTGEGGIAWMGYALTLRQVPEGLIATALSITVLVRLSAIPAENSALFRDTLAEGLRLAFILILPATVGLFLLARPIPALIFEHGSFTPHDTGVVAQALRWYLLGLPFSTIDLLLVVSFYARHNTRTPALIGVFTTFVYIGLCKILLPTLGLYSLMLADSVRFALHAGISLFFLRRSLGGLGADRTLWKPVLAVVALGAAITVTATILPPGENILNKGAAVLLPGTAGLLIYLGVLIALGSDDLQRLRRLLTARYREPPNEP